jgi:hypothetical protein
LHFALNAWPVTVIDVNLAFFACSTVMNFIFIYSLFIRIYLTVCRVFAIPLKYGWLDIFCMFIQLIMFVVLYVLMNFSVNSIKSNGLVIHNMVVCPPNS